MSARVRAPELQGRGGRVGSERLTHPAPVAVAGPARRTARPVTRLGPGPVRLSVGFAPPPGQHLDDRAGPATRLTVSASPAELLLAGGGSGADLERGLTLAAGSGVLHIAAAAAGCDDGVQHPACHLSQQDWGVPVEVVQGAPDELRLVLRGS